MSIKISDLPPTIFPLVGDELIEIVQGGLSKRATAAQFQAAAAFVAEFVVVSASPLLPNERVLTAGEAIQIVDGGVGGPITVSVPDQGIGTLKIADANVTNLKLANMAESTVKGRAVGSGVGAPVDLTSAQLTEILNVFTSVLKGLAPASGGGVANFLRADGGWAVPPGTTVGANPTAQVGLATINGVAATFMRSDAAPALSQAIVPTWTGEHTWQYNADALITLLLDNDSNGASNAARWSLASGDANAAWYVAGSGRTSSLVTSGPIGAQTVLRTLGADPIILATGNTERVRLDGAGVFDIRNGSIARVRDATNVDSVTVSHDGIDAIFDYVGTNWQRFRGLGLGVLFLDGAEIRIYDATNVDHADFSHNGVDFITNFTGTTNWNVNNISSLILEGRLVAAGADTPPLALQSSLSANMLHLDGKEAIDGNDVFLRLNQNNDFTSGTYTPGFLRVDGGLVSGALSSPGAGNFQVSGVMLAPAGTNTAPSYSFSSDSDVGMYSEGVNILSFVTAADRRCRMLVPASGRTASVQFDDFDGNLLDGGFNVLPAVAFNTSFTISERHCGHMLGKDSTTARTITLAASTNTDFPVSGVATVINGFTSGDITVTEGVGTTLYYLDGATRIDTAGGCTIGPGGFATIWRHSTAVYYIWGAGIMP